MIEGYYLSSFELTSNCCRLAHYHTLSTGQREINGNQRPSPYTLYQERGFAHLISLCKSQFTAARTSDPPSEPQLNVLRPVTPYARSVPDTA
eukprot:2284709-Rhodomonas_salina.9